MATPLSGSTLTGYAQTATTWYLCIGGNSNKQSPPTNVWVGDISDVATYNTNLSAAQVLTDATTNPVPEPSTVALLAVGVVSMLAYAWRKRR